MPDAPALVHIGPTSLKIAPLPTRQWQGPTGYEVFPLSLLLNQVFIIIPPWRAEEERESGVVDKDNEEEADDMVKETKSSHNLMRHDDETEWVITYSASGH